MLDPRGAGLHLAFQFIFIRSFVHLHGRFIVSLDQMLVPTQSLGTKEKREKGTKGQRDKGTKGPLSISALPLSSSCDWGKSLLFKLAELHNGFRPPFLLWTLQLLKYIIRWEGRAGVTITMFLNYIGCKLDQLFIKRNPQLRFEIK